MDRGAPVNRPRTLRIGRVLDAGGRIHQPGGRLPASLWFRLRQLTWQLSGGQQHLVALAAVMALRPEVVVVDEPVAELDPAHADGIYAALTDLNSGLGTTVIVVEHHAEYVARHARSVVLMADGAPVWHLPVREAMERVEELERHGIPAPQVVRATRSLAPWAPVPLTVEEAAAHLRAHVPEDRTEPDRPGDDRPEPDRPAAPATSARAVAPAGPRGTPVAQMSGVRHGYREVGGDLAVVLHDLDLTLYDGERVALVGGNGAGKSTLMRLFTGLKVPREGTVRVGGTDTRTVRPAALADQVCYLYQRPEQMFLKDNVREDVAMFPRGRGRPDTDTLVTDVLDRVDLTGLAHRDGRLLSGGQQRRATLAIGLAMRPALLLLDEPTSSLDTASRDAVIAMLDALADTIRCTVVATHDMNLVAEWAQRVLVLDQGRVIADTTPAELFADPGLMADVGLVAPQITRLGLHLGLNPPPLTVGELLDRHRPTRRIRA